MTEAGERDEKANGRIAGQIHIVMLRLAGLMAFENRDFKFVPTIALFIYVHCSHLIISSMFFCGTISHLIENKENFNVQAIAETVGLCGIHARYLVMFARRKKIAHIIDKSRSLWQKCTTDEEQFIRIFVSKSIKLLKLYMIINIMMCIFYLTASQLPLFSMGSSKNFTRTLPYMFYVRVEENSPYFATCVTIQMLSMFGVCISAWGVDGSTPFFIMLACGHFRILCNRLNSLQESMREGIRTNIVKCILYHQNIIEFCEEIEKLLSPVFLVQLCSSTYNIALAGMKLLDDDPNKFKYVSVLAIMLFQLFICQWGPDLLVTESGALIKSAYFIPESDDDDDLKTTKLIHIVIMRAQYSIHLKAGGFVNLSMETFGSVIKGIVSFFMVLRSFN